MLSLPQSNLYNVKEFMNDYIDNQLDIVHEIFISQYAPVSYKNLMQGINTTDVSPRSFQWYLTDKNNYGRYHMTHIGITTLYRSEMPEHFDGDYWQPKYTFEFFKYTVRKLLDERYIKSNNKRSKYASSLLNPQWVFGGSMLGCFKMLEENYNKCALKSEIATNNLNTRYKAKSIQVDIFKLLALSKKYPSSANKYNKMIAAKSAELNKLYEAQQNIQKNNPEMIIYYNMKQHLDHALSILPQEIKAILNPFWH